MKTANKSTKSWEISDEFRERDPLRSENWNPVEGTVQRIRSHAQIFHEMGRGEFFEEICRKGLKEYKELEGMD